MGLRREERHPRDWSREWWMALVALWSEWPFVLIGTAALLVGIWLGRRF